MELSYNWGIHINIPIQEFKSLHDRTLLDQTDVYIYQQEHWLTRMCSLDRFYHWRWSLKKTKKKMECPSWKVTSLLLNAVYSDFKGQNWVTLSYSQITTHRSQPSNQNDPKSALAAPRRSGPIPFHPPLVCADP